MKKIIGLTVAVVLLYSGLSYGALFGKSDKEVQEEIEKREAVLTASFNETLAQKDREIERLKAENAELSTKLEEANKSMEEMTKKIQELEKVSLTAPTEEKEKETRSLEEIITTEITKYAQVITSGEEIKIIFNTDFFFYYDVLEPPVFRSLDVIVKALKTYPEHRIIISGHTDSMGNEKKNLQTSLIKAKAVANYFIARGIPEEKMIVKGVGSAQPVATNKTKEGRKQNRRVEIIVK